MSRKGGVKKAAYTFTALLLLNCVLLISFAGVIHGRYDKYFSYISDRYNDITIYFMTVGAVQIAISLFGFASFIQEKRWMIILFSILLCLTLFLQAIGGVLAFLFENKIYDDSITALQEAVINYDSNSTQIYQEVMDWNQAKFSCCGVMGPSEYEQNNVTSLCPDKTPVTCHSGYRCGGVLFTEGCLNDFTDFMEKHLIILGIVAFALGPFLQVINFILSCYLSVLIKQLTCSTGNWS